MQRNNRISEVQLEQYPEDERILMLIKFLDELYSARVKYDKLVRSPGQFNAWINDLVAAHPLERPYFIDMCPRIGKEVNRVARRAVARGPNALLALESEQEIFNEHEIIELEEVPYVEHEEIVETEVDVEAQVALIKSYIAFIYQVQNIPSYNEY